MYKVNLKWPRVLTLVEIPDPIYEVEIVRWLFARVAYE